MTLVARLLSHFRMNPAAERPAVSGDVFATRLSQMHTRNGVTCRKTPFRSSRQHRAA